MKTYLRWFLIWIPGAGFIWWLGVEAMPVSSIERPAPGAALVDR